VLLLAAGAIALFLSFALPASQDMHRFRSPDGRFDVTVVVEIKGGATGEVATMAYLETVGSSFPKFTRKRIMKFEGDDVADHIKVMWTAPNSIDVRVPGDTKVVEECDFVNGIAVHLTRIQ
jgi:hypothetical protein